MDDTNGSQNGYRNGHAQGREADAPPPLAEVTLLEGGVLGGVLLKASRGEGLGDLPTIIPPDTFEHPITQDVWRAIQVIHGRGELPDPALLYSEIARLHQLGTVKTPLVEASRFLETVVTDALPPQTLERVLAELVDRAQQRRLWQDTYQTLQRLRDQPPPTVQEMLRALESVMAPFQLADAQRQLVPLSQVLGQELPRLERVAQGEEAALPPLSTGITILDEVLGGGLKPGLNLLGARPSVGKTSTALGWGLLASLVEQALTVYLSLESELRELALRSLVWETGAHQAVVPYERLEYGPISDTELLRLEQAVQLLQTATLFLRYGSLTPGLLRSYLRTMRQAGTPVRLVIIDYVQLMEADAHIRDTRQRLNAVSKALADISKEENVCILALAQLTRAAEGQSHRRPTKADLKETGNFEQDADVIILLHPHPEKPDIMEIIVDKHRNGRTGVVEAGWNGEAMRLEPLVLLNADEAQVVLSAEAIRDARTGAPNTLTNDPLFDSF